MTDLIVDSCSCFSRAFFALARAPVEDQQPASIVSFRTILKLLDHHRLPRVDRILMCWDGGHKNEKNRAPKPDGYHEERDRFKLLTEELLGAAQCEADYEADDAVVAAAYRSEADGNVVIVVSGDKDLAQCQGDKIIFYSLNEKDVLSRQTICAKWGIHRPIHIPIYLAIVGDAVDNIPGIPKFGKVKAAKLLQTVTEDMNFSAALDAVRKQLKPDQARAFDECLELTLLDANADGIPEPADIVMAEPAELERYEAEAIRGDYVPVYCSRNGIDLDDYYDLSIEDA